MSSGKGALTDHSCRKGCEPAHTRLNGNAFEWIRSLEDWFTASELSSVARVHLKERVTLQDAEGMEG